MKFIKPIFLGVIAAGGALVFELLLQGFFPAANFSASTLSLNIIFFLIIAAAIEEFFKLMVIYKSFYLPTRDADENNKGIIFSSLCLGLGFSLTEIALSNYFSISGSPGLYLGILGIIFIHTLSAGLIGYFLLKTKARTSPVLIVILFTATLIHFTYNAAVFSGYLQK